VDAEGDRDLAARTMAYGWTLGRPPDDRPASLCRPRPPGIAVVSTRTPLLSRFFRRLGNAVHDRDGVCWVEVGRFSLSAVPATEAIVIPRATVEAVLRDTGRLAATFVSADGVGVPAVAWWVRDREYGLPAVQRQFRQNLRRGEGMVTVRRVEWDDFRRHGLAVHREATAARRGPAPPTTGIESWNALCDLFVENEGFEAIGCFVESVLAGYIVSLATDGVCEGLLADCAPRFASLRPAHWLYHRFAAEMIRRPDVRGVTVGRQGIPARESLDAFKRHAGFRPEPLRVAAVLHPRWRNTLQSAPVRGFLRWAGGVLGRRAGPLSNVALLDAAVETCCEMTVTAGERERQSEQKSACESGQS
jgi:hypothetical protein